MELEVQKYLRSKSLDDLKAELGIEFSEYQSLVVLNYSQIDSPKIHPIVSECRGLILEKDTWNIISYPFKRFFNYEEVQEQFDFEKSVAIQKLDGSLISFFYYNSQWLMATRGVIENASNVGFSNISFKDLFYETLKRYNHNDFDKSFCYCFELTAPENRVVTMYDERELHLLTMREIGSWAELSLPALKEQSKKLGIDLPMIVDPIYNKDEIISLAKNMATLQEGFVAINYSCRDTDGISFKRIKVKNPSYVAIHHLKDSAGRSLRSLVGLVLDNEQDEFLGYFPEFKPHIDKVKDKFDEYLKTIDEDVKKVVSLFSLEKTKENRKAFAEIAVKTKNSELLFQLYDNKVKDVHDFFNKIESTKGRKHLEKYLVDRMHLKDINLFSEE